MSAIFTLVTTSGLVNLTLKSAAIMLVALGAAMLLRRRSAAVRHLAWTLGILCLLLLPVGSLLLPEWQVGWIPDWMSPRGNAVAEKIPVASAALPNEPILTQPVMSEAAQGLPFADVNQPVKRMPSTSTPTAIINLTHIGWVPLVWGMGVLLTLVPLGIGLWRVRVLQAASCRVENADWLRLLEEARRQVDLRQNVQLLCSDEVRSPLTWGVLRPVVLIPAQAGEWPEKRLHCALLHELAHVRRKDWLAQILAHLACSIYWFNPLVWLAARQMRVERERACDDVVLTAGVRATDDARELLRLAASLPLVRRPALAAIPMARSSFIEGRVRNILEIRRNRRQLSVVATCTGVLVAGLLLAPLAMMAAPPSNQLVQLENEQPVPPGAFPPAQKPADVPPGKPVTVRGKLLDDATGEPITPNIIIQAGKFDPALPEKVTWGFSETRSSRASGTFDVEVRWSEGWTARILADGYMPQPVISRAPPPGTDVMDVTLRLKRGISLRGAVLDHTGAPLKDAGVFAIGATSLNLYGGDARARFEGDKIDNNARPVRTDAQGRFELSAGGAQRVAVSHPAFDLWAVPIPKEGELTIRLPRPARVDIEFDVEGANAESVIFYQFLNEGLPDFKGVETLREIRIANPGKLSLAGLPPGKYQFSRHVVTRVGDLGKGQMLDRQFVELKPGEVKALSFTRKEGARIRGKVILPANTELSGVVVSVREEPRESGPLPGGTALPRTYSSQKISDDGTFLTEHISPGTYRLLAEGYMPETPELERTTGRRGPSHVAEIRVEVPASGELAAPDLVLVPTANPPAAQPVPAAPPPAPAPAPAKPVTVRGKLVDDATGEPITPNIIIQAGKFDPALPEKVTWGFSETRSGRASGTFDAQVHWSEGWTARILADGYMPQPVISKAPPPGTDVMEVTLRLKRGISVQGRVLDHTGAPLKDAGVFAVSPTSMNLYGGQAWTSYGSHEIDKQAKPVRTDDQGRFELAAGGAQRVALSHPAFDLWAVPVPTEGELTIRLPKPVRVDIEMDVEGSSPETVIFYQFLNEGLPDFKGVETIREVKVPNPGKLSLEALPPGKYQFSRNVMHRLGDMGRGEMLDRQYVELKAGEVKAISFARKTGARIRGKVILPPKTELSGVVVSVREEPRDADKVFGTTPFPRTFSSQKIADDGTFLTERILPGTYRLVVEGYTPETPEQQMRISGWRGPSHINQVRIEVPASGELAAPELSLDIEKK